MKEFVEKLIERLEEASHYEEPTFDEDGYCNDDSWEVVYLDKAIEIIKQLAEEYVPETNVGKWVPCTERLPEEPGDNLDIGRLELFPEYNVTIDGATKSTTLYYVGNGEWCDNDYNQYKVIAWQPLPEAYKPEQQKEIPTNYYTERFNRVM